MCPACLTAVTMAIIGTTSATGVSALVVKLFQRISWTKQIPARSVSMFRVSPKPSILSTSGSRLRDLSPFNEFLIFPSCWSIRAKLSPCTGLGDIEIWTPLKE